MLANPLRPFSISSSCLSAPLSAMPCGVWLNSDSTLLPWCAFLYASSIRLCEALTNSRTRSRIMPFADFVASLSSTFGKILPEIFPPSSIILSSEVSYAGSPTISQIDFAPTGGLVLVTALSVLSALSAKARSGCMPFSCLRFPISCSAVKRSSLFAVSSLRNSSIGSSFGPLFAAGVASRSLIQSTSPMAAA